MPWVSSSISSRVEIRVPENLAPNFGAEIVPLQFLHRHLMDGAAAVGHPVDGAVVAEHKHLVPGEVDVVFEAVGSLSIARRKAGRVFSGA